MVQACSVYLGGLRAGASDSRKVTHRFPKGARNTLGKELTRIQMGLQPRDGKWLTDIGPGVQRSLCRS